MKKNYSLTIRYLFEKRIIDLSIADELVFLLSLLFIFIQKKCEVDEVALFPLVSISILGNHLKQRKRTEIFEISRGYSFIQSLAKKKTLKAFYR